MFAFAKNVMLMAIFINTKVHAAISLTGECMNTTPNLGNPDRAGATFNSNMSDLIDKLGGKEIFMRTAGLFFCHGPDNIYGVQVALEHDIEKDPDHTQVRGNSKMFYETLIGSKAGDCDFIRNDRDNWI